MARATKAKAKSAAVASALGVVLLGGCATTEVVTVEPLAILSLVPTHGAVNIDPTTSIIATFSREIDAGSLGSQGFYVAQIDPTGAEVARVAADVAYAQDALTATLTPRAPLGAHERYRATLTTEISDLEGEHLAGEVSALFTTL